MESIRMLMLQAWYEPYLETLKKSMLFMMASFLQ